MKKKIKVVERLQRRARLVRHLASQSYRRTKIFGLRNLGLFRVRSGLQQGHPLLGFQGWWHQGFARAADRSVLRWRHQDVRLPHQRGQEVAERADLHRPVGISEAHLERGLCLSSGWILENNNISFLLAFLNWKIMDLSALPKCADLKKQSDKFFSETKN